MSKRRLLEFVLLIVIANFFKNCLGAQGEYNFANFNSIPGQTKYACLNVNGDETMLFKRPLHCALTCAEKTWCASFTLELDVCKCHLHTLVVHSTSTPIPDINCIHLVRTQVTYDLYFIQCN